MDEVTRRFEVLRQTLLEPGTNRPLASLMIAMLAVLTLIALTGVALWVVSRRRR